MVAEATGTKAQELATDKSVAALLLSIDQELAATVLRHFSDDTVDKITLAMQELQGLALGSEELRRIYGSAVERMRSSNAGLGDVGGTMESVMVKAFGEDRGSDVTRRANSDILAKKPFAMFEALTPEDLANLLTEEHPQIAAVFMAHLDQQKGGQVLRFLDEDARADLVHRVATLDRTPPEVVQRVLEVMRKKVKDLGLNTLRAEPKAWVKAAAQILNNMGGGERGILEKIEGVDSDMAAAIRDEMFTIEDIQKLDKKSIQKILATVDSRLLAVALKAIIPPVEQAILNNLSQRAAGMVIEERDSLGPMPLSEVLEAQNEILKLIRELMDKGEIAAGGAGEQMV
ncbi:MAG: flagellar motor switch protein FliG [Planctomycetota bacterium]|nr:flagellar motor switch protein FliG [Planctomycetota bacterium]